MNNTMLMYSNDMASSGDVKTWLDTAYYVYIYSYCCYYYYYCWLIIYTANTINVVSCYVYRRMKSLLCIQLLLLLLLLLSLILLIRTPPQRLKLLIRTPPQRIQLLLVLYITLIIFIIINNL